MTTPNLEFDELIAAQSQPEVLVNRALRRADVIIQLGVIDKDTTAPPGSPADGDAYIVPPGATGAWLGHTEHVAYYSNGWLFLIPQQGWLCYVIDEASFYVFVAGSPQQWVILTTGGGGGATDIDLGMCFPGTPITAQLMFKFVAVRAFSFPANFTGSSGHIGTNPTGSFVMNVSVAGAAVGTITISTGGVFTFATTAGAVIPVAIGERVEIAAPVSVDITAADIAATLLADL